MIQGKIKIGAPVKIKTSGSNYLYGRMYGFSNLYWPDGSKAISYCLLAVTTNGNIIKGGPDYFSYINNIEDYRKLMSLERRGKKPYSPYLEKSGDNYFSTGLYEKLPVKFGYYPDNWFDDNEYLDIDQRIFGEALSIIFSKELGVKHYFQQIPVIRDTSVDIPINSRTTETRYMSIISPTKYNDNDFNYTMENPHYKKSIYDSNTAFSKYPVVLNEKDFLLYFSKCTGKIRLGSLNNGIFTVNNFDDQIFGKSNEIHYNNPHYKFIESFINEVIKYKLDNRKPIIDQKDIETILEKFGISRQEKINKIVSILKQVQSDYIRMLSETHKVGQVLELKKSNNLSHANKYD